MPAFLEAVVLRICMVAVVFTLMTLPLTFGAIIAAATHRYGVLVLTHLAALAIGACWPIRRLKAVLCWAGWVEEDLDVRTKVMLDELRKEHPDTFLTPGGPS